MARDFSTVGVIGLGTMGAGIVEVFARNGIDVVAVEVDDAAVEHGRSILQHSTDRAVSRGKLTVEDQAALLSRVTFTSDMGDLRDCQLVVEAVPEHLDLKKEIFAKVDGIVAPDAVLATNTSSLPVTEIAVATSNPKRVVGHALLQPCPGAAVRRGRAHGHHRGRGLRGRQGPGPAPRQAARRRRATRPGSSRTRCSSATSTTPSRCSRASTPRARTSTPRCASAAATRWARSR